mmetsp:Transcript_10635/g.19303  ORF Transcript_10635/g.19303 Transcript_10635/m.19303 type:complete len:314 (+) Transcript_10635:182-1123(+)
MEHSVTTITTMTTIPHSENSETVPEWTAVASKKANGRADGDGTENDVVSTVVPAVAVARVDVDPTASATMANEESVETNVMGTKRKSTVPRAMILPTIPTVTTTDASGKGVVANRAPTTAILTKDTKDDATRRPPPANCNIATTAETGSDAMDDAMDAKDAAKADARRGTSNASETIAGKADANGAENGEKIFPAVFANSSKSPQQPFDTDPTAATSKSTRMGGTSNASETADANGAEHGETGIPAVSTNASKSTTPLYGMPSRTTATSESSSSTRMGRWASDVPNVGKNHERNVRNRVKRRARKIAATARKA